MKTVEERALFYERRCTDNAISSDGGNLPRPFQSYIAGAEQQKQIDINKSCDILTELGFFKWLAESSEEGFSAEVYKGQFIECMKEEA